MLKQQFLFYPNNAPRPAAASSSVTSGFSFFFSSFFSSDLVSVAFSPDGAVCGWPGRQIHFRDIPHAES